jgi:hypothetical protein
MEKQVLVNDFQKADAEDFNKQGQFTTEAIDHLTLDAIEPEKSFTGFNVTVSPVSQAVVIVAPGRVYDQGECFFRDDVGGLPIDFSLKLPIAAKRIATILVAAPEATDQLAIEDREYLVNVVTREVQAKPTATQTWRLALVTHIIGQESASPLPLPPDSQYLPIAYVTLDPNGVSAIEMIDQNRMRPLRLAHRRLDDNDDFRTKIGSAFETLGTTVTGLAQGIKGVATIDMAKRLAFDVAQVKDQLGLPDDYTAWSSDHFLDESESDPANLNYIARVEEGIRFPHQQTQDATLALLNPLDPNVAIANNFMVPAYTLSKRISIVGNDAEISASQFQYQTTTLVQKTRTREVLRWGATYTYCTNSSWWQSGRYDPVTGILTRADGEFQVIDGNGNPLKNHNVIDHTFERLIQLWRDEVQDNYWESVTVTAGVNGSLAAETFLNTQDGYLANLNLFFSRVAAAGDVLVAICEVTDSGAPNPKAVLARVNVPVANLKAYPAPTPVPMPLVFLEKGVRYGFIVITAGQHFLSLVQGNKYAQGSFFSSTDGAWFQGDLLRDIAFEAEFCSFKTPRVEIPMQPLSLAGGIVNIEFNYDSCRPDGTSISHEVQVGATWRTIGEANGLTGLPAQVSYRVVMQGTTDVMPGMGVGPNSKVTTWRPRPDFKHFSRTRNMPAGLTTNQVDVNIRLEWWDPALHACTVKLLTGPTFATVETYDHLDELTPVEDAGARERKYTFNLPAPVSAYKIEIDGTTTNVLRTFHVAGRTDIAV